MDQIISEYAYEGYLYMYDEQPDNMRQLEQFLSEQSLHVSTLYRRTDWSPILKAQTCDTLILNRVSSWSYNDIIPNAMYDGIASVMLILSDATIWHQKSPCSTR